MTDNPIINRGINTYHELILGGELMVIGVDKIVYWPAQQALILSDLHLGKATHFRKHGVYVPGDVLTTELARLDHALSRLDLQRVYILGDLFHASYNAEWPTFTSWMKQYKHIAWVLIKGNHDVLGLATYQEAGFEVIKDILKVGNICLAHKPEDLIDLAEADYGIAGHIHPGYMLGAKGLGKVRMPCFWIRPKYAVLPAWGSFTGLDTVSPTKADRLVVMTDKQLWDINP